MALGDCSGPGICRDWAAAERRQGRAAQRRAHGERSGRLQHHGQVAGRQRARGPAASLPASLSGSVVCLPGVCAPGLLRDPLRPAAPGSRSPARDVPGCSATAAGTKKTRGPAARSNPPPSPPPEPERSQHRFLWPAEVSRSQTAPFSSQPTRARRHGVPRPRAEDPVPASASRDPAPRTVLNGAGWRVGGA